jgi:hypothetical protein
MLEFELQRRQHRSTSSRSRTGGVGVVTPSAQSVTRGKKQRAATQ